MPPGLDNETFRQLILMPGFESAKGIVSLQGMGLLPVNESPVSMWWLFLIAVGVLIVAAVALINQENNEQ